MWHKIAKVIVSAIFGLLAGSFVAFCLFGCRYLYCQTILNPDGNGAYALLLFIICVATLAATWVSFMVSMEYFD